MGYSVKGSGGEMHLQNAKTIFIHRGIECWTKVVRDTGKVKNTHFGYFRMTIPGVNGQRDMDSLFIDNGGKDKLPNGGRFTYLVRGTGEGEVIAGFDGDHDENVNNPLTDQMAQDQIKIAVDFLLDNGLGSLAHIPHQA